MALREIVIAGKPGDEVLHKVAKAVPEVNDHIREIIDDMTETMRAADGAGLAAPQIGILRRIVVVEIEGKLYEIVNPVITETKGQQEEIEACLSIPGYMGKVKRPKYVKVRGIGRDGKPVEFSGEGMFAKAFCHECDHLDGVLYTSVAEEVYDDDEIEEEK